MKIVSFFTKKLIFFTNSKKKNDTFLLKHVVFPKIHFTIDDPYPYGIGVHRPKARGSFPQLHRSPRRQI